MKRFAALYDAVDQTTSTLAKVAALEDYFRTAPPADAAWALFFLTGQRFKRLIATRELREWTEAFTGLPAWLFGESYAAVGDLAETVALLVATYHDHPAPPPPPPARDKTLDLFAPAPDAADEATAALADLPLHLWIVERIQPLRVLDEDRRRRRVLAWWRVLPPRQLYLLVKLLTGELRIGVSATLVERALAQAASLPPPVIAHRLMGDWQPSAASYAALFEPAADAAALTAAGVAPGATSNAQPYPFYLASPLTDAPESLGDVTAWLVEWKWDGIRAQLIRRGGEAHLWSRGEALITRRFPELIDASRALPDGVVLDGEVLAFRDGRPLPFAVLQRRIGREDLDASILDDAPVAYVAYDLLEHDGADARAEPLAIRRAKLESVLAASGLGGDLNAPSRILVSPRIDASDWSALAALRAESRARGVEGLMLKQLDSPYRAGRRRGHWWKWKIAPHSLDAVLVYAQPGTGRRASLLTDYTFAVWDGGELVPVAKAYSGLTDEEILDLDRWVRAHTIERHGPVRAVEPTQVFELAFEALARSTRHRSGIALRFPRILRRRMDKRADEADTLERVAALLAPET